MPCRNLLVLPSIRQTLMINEDGQCILEYCKYGFMQSQLLVEKGAEYIRHIPNKLS